VACSWLNPRRRSFAESHAPAVARS
jgi:hypothetical protein